MPFSRERPSADDAMRRNAEARDGNIDRYLEWNLSMFPIEPGRRILDLGCGPGQYFDSIARYRPAFYRGVDPNHEFITRLRRLQDGGAMAADALEADLYDREAVARIADRPFDYVLCFDVLEHLEDDAAALENIRRIALRAGATHIFIRVPALQRIYGVNDRAIGHFRRYHRNELAALLERCRLEVETVRYQNAAGILPWFVVGRVLRRELATTAAESRGFDMAVPALRWIERRIPPPVGLSLYGVCRPAAGGRLDT